MKFKPTQYDLDWTKNLLSKMNEGGIWSYRSGPIAIQVFPSKLEFKFNLAGLEDLGKKDSNVERLRIVMKKLNWKEV